MRPHSEVPGGLEYWARQDTWWGDIIHGGECVVRVPESELVSLSPA